MQHQTENTYRALYRTMQQTLPSAFEARQLFAHVTGRTTMELPVFGGGTVPEDMLAQANRLCARRQAGEPLQYLLGEWEFYGLPFFVGPGVLIPRQDTETLVEAALARIKGREQPDILDLCSGTGCIAVALQHHRPDAQVTAVEWSPEALIYLKKNVALHRNRVQPIHADLRTYTHPTLLDLVVSNPPYIPQHTLDTLQTEVQHEPRCALDGGADGLDFYRAIIGRYSTQIRPGGWLCLEVGAGQSDAVCAMMEKNEWKQPEIQADATGILRVVSAQRG